MLIPLNLFNVLEYDATFVVTPTSRFDHSSDTVLATVELLVHNDQQEDIEFPFVTLTTDPGTGATDPSSVQPHILNGSRPVDVIEDDDVDEASIAERVVAQARAAGVTDEAELQSYRRWALAVVRRAERTTVGRTRIEPGERRRVILQQRLRVQPDKDGRFIFETIAPSPIARLATGGRVSVVVLMPWEDEDVKPEILERTEGFEMEQGRIKMRAWTAWFWRNDPVFRLVYRYAG